MRLAARLVFTSLVFVSLEAHAQNATEDPSAIAAARGLGTEGVRLAEAGNCKDAVVKLERAERFHHAPTTLGRLGECQIALGRLVLGSELLQRVVREQLNARAPQAFVLAKVRAKRVLDDVLPRIAKLHLHVDSAPGIKPPQITLDGGPLASEWLDMDRPIDPGVHTVVVSAEGHADAIRTVTMAEGERTEVTLALTPAPESSSTAPTSSTSGAPASSERAPASPPPSSPERVAAPEPKPLDPSPQRGMAPRQIAGLTVIGVGSAAMIVGGVFGVMAISTKNSLDDACGPAKSCPLDQRDEISSLKSQSVISTVGLVTGGLGLAAGAFLLLTHSSNSKHAGGLSIGPTSVSWRGHF